MIEIILLFGAFGFIGIAFILSAIIYYPLDRSRNNATLKEYLKELF